MTKKDYKWKRFWCPRSGRINLADGGYLYDPDEEWGKVYNPDLVSLEVISDLPCLILLGEPGIGKSRELENLKTLTKTKINDSSKVLELNLRSCTNLREDLFKNETFTDWLAGSHHLYLFLDSLDEGLLSIPTLATGLIDELKKPEYQNHINRLHLRLASRTFVFPAILEEELKNLWKEANFAIYELAPLRRIDVIQAAKAEDLYPDDFLKEIRQKDVVPLAIKPITLRFLLNTYRRQNGQFPPDQKLHELYLDGCKILCEEVNESRHASDRTGNFNSDQRLIVAARIAAVTIFANRFAVWTSVDQGDVPAEDVLLQKLSFSCEEANGREFEITEKVIKEVLDTGLFSSRGLHRMGWAHQTYAEFLAAWYLRQHEIPLEQITLLIFSPEDPEHKLIPQLHETAAWLASLRLDVLQEIIKTDPDVLLQTDVPTDAEIRASIVDNLLTQYEAGKLFDRGKNNYRHYAKLKHPGLVERLRPYICDSSKQEDTRDLAIDIAEVCEISQLQEELVNLALDSSQLVYLRASAARALGSISDGATRLKLKPLAIEPLQEDQDDQIKGYALSALWPSYLTAEELFQALTPRKKMLFFGGYHMFLDYQIVPNLQPQDLVVALNWLALQGLRCFKHPFEELGDAILFKAWENFELPGVAESFTQVALIQWREFQRIITHDKKLQEQFFVSLSHDTKKRHILIEQAVLTISETEEDPLFLLASLTEENVLVSGDIFWMISRLQDITCENTQRIWSRLIQKIFNRQDANQIDAIILATHVNSILQDMFEPYFVPIELDSAQAERLRDDYLRLQDYKKYAPLLDPSPKVRVLQLLEEFEAGDLSAWWQLNREMTLLPTSQYYPNEWELDLTKLPGWQEAEEDTRSRIIDGAKNYVQQKNDITYDWIGTNMYPFPELAGCSAFQLFLKHNSSFLVHLSPEIWKRWAPVIIAAPISNRQEDSYLELVKHVFLNAFEESTKTLITIIDNENQEYDNLFVINCLVKCLDDRLKLALLEKSKDPKLKPKCVGQLLEMLLKSGVAEAKVFLNHLIVFPLPLADNEREKSLIAAQILTKNSEPSDWSFIWSLIQQDTYFGRKLIERAACQSSRRIQFNLTETQLADLYIWLVRNYPYNEDSDYSNRIDPHVVTARDSIASLRDSVLSQLKERGTLHACAEIEHLLQELPDLAWLRKTLMDAQANMRRRTWQPLTSEDFLQFVISQEPSNSDLSKQLHEIKQQMAEQPSIQIGSISGGINNFTPNQGTQNLTQIETQNNYTTDLNLLQTIQDLLQQNTDLKNFITDLETQNPSLPTETEAEAARDKAIANLQNNNPILWKNIRAQMRTFKRQLLNLERHAQAAKATIVEVAKTYWEKSLIAKAIITYIDKLSETPDQEA